MATTLPTTRPVTELLSLHGKVALITGATGHLGSAMAAALAEAGATVIASSRRIGAAKAVADGLPRSGEAKHFGVAIDHTDEKSIRDGFAAAVEHAGQIDILVNNGHDAIGVDWTTVTAEQFSEPWLLLMTLLLPAWKPPASCPLSPRRYSRPLGTL